MTVLRKVSAANDLRVGLCFPADSIAYWYQKINIAVERKIGKNRLILCPRLQDLQGVHPNIIIGHESRDLIEYISQRPPTLRWVQIMSAGVDRTLKALADGRVQFRISNMRGIHGNAMVEYLLAILLHFEKKIDQMAQNKQKKKWHRVRLGALTGKQLLICGAGSIGQQVASVMNNLGVEVDGLARTTKQRPGFGKIFQIPALNAHIEKYHYIFCSLPLTHETKELFDRTMFQRVKMNSIFVNVGRGGVVVETALCEALRQGRLAGAGLDVFGAEPLPASSCLWDAPNTIITPHIAGRVAGGHDLAVHVIEQNIEAFLANKLLPTEVFVDQGY